MSTQPVPQPSWKQEVNKRLEAHKNRRGISVVEQDVRTEEQGGVSDRAAQAAARVAARFSKAPSYSEMQAAEARAALRAAEAATRAALEAQAAAQAALANLVVAQEQLTDRVEEYAAFESELETETQIEIEQEPEPVQMSWEPEPAQIPVSYEAGKSWEIRWEPDLPVRSAELPDARSRSQHEAQTAADDWGMQLPVEFEHDHAVVEPAQPIHANLIHFPRELVAARRLRPRLSTSPTGEVSEQLSIFEVDPSTISIDPMVSAAEATLDASIWSSPEWSSIKLDAQPHHEPEIYHEPAAVSASNVHLAPLQWRLLAATIDIALVIGLVCAGAMGMAGHLHHSAPNMKAAEVGAAVAFVLTGILYQVFFLLIARSTPGMIYAGISLCTFDDEHPTRAQLRDRVWALLVSLLPIGLGVAWAIFDDDHLSWHDRLSRTYQRKG